MNRLIITTFAAALISLLSLSAFAAEPSVKITSFSYVNGSHDMAELCGEVSNATSAPTYVQVTVDPNTKNPAFYNVFAGRGKFCTVVVTYSGTAIAEIL